MSAIERTDFVPILTVLAETGPAYIWVVRRPDQEGVGPNLCDLMGWSDDFPMSHGLWQKFSDWAVEFHQACRDAFFADEMADDWDWRRFHAWGMLLSRWLKEEVGDAYRVVYYKPHEDPNYGLDERTEILADGSLLALEPFRRLSSKSAPLLRHIVSGGQTGADRAALDFAIANGYTHGGWAPQGREAEDGPIALKYQLNELPAGGYRERTRRNVEDSDGTLIVNLGKLDGGTLATQQFAQTLGRPYRLVAVDAGVAEDAVADILSWLKHHHIKTLNVAGPRESRRPGIYRLTTELLLGIHTALHRSE